MAALGVENEDSSESTLRFEHVGTVEYVGTFEHGVFDNKAHLCSSKLDSMAWLRSVPCPSFPTAADFDRSRKFTFARCRLTPSPVSHDCVLSSGFAAVLWTDCLNVSLFRTSPLFVVKSNAVRLSCEITFRKDVVIERLPVLGRLFEGPLDSMLRFSGIYDIRA